MAAAEHPMIESLIAAARETRYHLHYWRDHAVFS